PSSPAFAQRPGDAPVRQADDLHIASHGIDYGRAVLESGRLVRSEVQLVPSGRLHNQSSVIGQDSTFPVGDRRKLRYSGCHTPSRKVRKLAATHSLPSTWNGVNATSNVTDVPGYISAIAGSNHSGGGGPASFAGGTDMPPPSCLPNSIAPRSD